MELKPGISVTLITLNEEANIARALQSVRFANETIVVDCGSTDRTLDIARSFGAKIYSNPWRGYGQQKNFAQSKASHTWVLNVDADEEVSPELKEEILQIVAQSETAFQGFEIPRKTFFRGHWIRHGGWYPNRIARLARTASSKWSEPHLHEVLQVQGKMGQLHSPLLHYSFDGIEDQVKTNLRYARAGASDLATKRRPYSTAHLVFKPIGKFIETYLIKAGFLDGLPGFIISVNAAYSMFLKYAFTLEALRENPNHR